MKFITLCLLRTMISIIHWCPLISIDVHWYPLISTIHWYSKNSFFPYRLLMLGTPELFDASRERSPQDPTIFQTVTVHCDVFLKPKKITSWTVQWIGLRENLNRKAPYLMGNFPNKTNPINCLNLLFLLVGSPIYGWLSLVKKHVCWLPSGYFSHSHGKIHHAING